VRPQVLIVRASVRRSALAVELGIALLVLGALLLFDELGRSPQLWILLKEGGPVEEDAYVAEAVGLAHAKQPRVAQHAEAWEEGLQPFAQQQQLLAAAVRVLRLQPATASARGAMRTGLVEGAGIDTTTGIATNEGAWAFGAT
jgi:hypothetical protein